MMIRPAVVEDIPQLIWLASQAATAAHWTEPQYRAALATSHPRRLLLVISDDEIVGFAVAADMAGEWELENIVVSTAQQGQGWGSRLLKTLLDAVCNTGGDCVFLEVRESNSSARLLYEKHGFVASGRRRGYYHNPPEDAILYKKILCKAAPEIG